MTAAQDGCRGAGALPGQGKLPDRLIAIYKSDTPDLTTVLLESDGFSDLLTRAATCRRSTRPTSSWWTRSSRGGTASGPRLPGAECAARRPSR